MFKFFVCPKHHIIHLFLTKYGGVGLNNTILTISISSNNHIIFLFLYLPYVADLCENAKVFREIAKSDPL